MSNGVEKKKSKKTTFLTFLVDSDGPVQGCRKSLFFEKGIFAKTWHFLAIFVGILHLNVHENFFYT